VSASRLRPNNEQSVAKEENRTSSSSYRIDIKLGAVDMNTSSDRVCNVLIRATIS
jgi:hypothetical protein